MPSQCNEITLKHRSMCLIIYFHTNPTQQRPYPMIPDSLEKIFCVESCDACSSQLTYTGQWSQKVSWSSDYQMKRYLINSNIVFTETRIHNEPNNQK